MYPATDMNDPSLNDVRDLAEDAIIQRLGRCPPRDMFQVSAEDLVREPLSMLSDYRFRLRALVSAMDWEQTTLCFQSPAGPIENAVRPDFPFLPMEPEEEDDEQEDHLDNECYDQPIPAAFSIIAQGTTSAAWR